MKSRKHDKYIFDEEEIEKECYLIASCVMASEQIHLLQRKSSNWGIKRFILEEQYMIKKHLISLAIKLRMIDDLMKLHKHTDYIPFLKNKTGTIEEINKKKDLTIREACNKIIHANNIEFKFKYSQHGSKKIRYLAPEIILHGKKGKVSWKATMKILRFVDLALKLCIVYDESWDVSAYS
jgi:hypothetical protein